MEHRLSQVLLVTHTGCFGFQVSARQQNWAAQLLLNLKGANHCDTTPAGLLSSRFIEYVLHMFLLIQDKFLNSIHVFKMSERGVENLDFWKSLCANGIKPPTNKSKYLESVQKHLYKELGVEKQECSEATYKDIDKQASNFL